MKTEKNDRAVNTRIPTATWEWLTSIGTAGGVMKTIISEAETAAKAGVSPFDIAESIAVLQSIRKRSQGELKGVFTQAEWCYMADSLNGTIITVDFRSVPATIITNVEDSDLYEGLGAKRGVNVKNLCAKIENLTAAQADAVFTRIENFWADEDRDLEEWSRW